MDNLKIHDRVKRRISFAVLCLFLLSLLSCASSNETYEVKAGSTDGVTESTETSSMPEGDGLPELDLDGWELAILNYDETQLTWANTRILVDEADGDILNDALYKRNSELMERFNFTLRVDEVANVIDHIKNYVSAGDDTYDIYVMQEGQLLGYMPYILDWNLIPGLRLDEAWWNPEATSVYNIAGEQTALAGNMTLTAVSRAVSIVFNKRIWNEYGDPSQSLYDLVYDNEWTIDKFIELSRSVCSDLNGDTVWDEDDLYGMFMGRGFKGYIASFLCASNMNFTEPDESGRQHFTLNTNERGLELIKKLLDAWQSDGYTYYTGDVHTGAPADFFEGGHALFSQRVPNDIYRLRDMNDDIGILPMPKYDEEQENYCSAAWGGAVWTLSATFDPDGGEAEGMGVVLDALSYYGWRDVVPVYKEVALKTKTTRDEDSAAMLDIIFDTIYFDFGTNILYDAVIADGMLNRIYKSRSSDSMISIMESELARVEKYIDDIYSGE